MLNQIRIATRGSKLALWQAHHVGGLIAQKYPSIKIDYNVITTSGDRIQDKPLYEVGGKGLFLKEIEEALLADTADLAVHSLKDVPFELPEGLQLSTILPREDARDALISRDGLKFNELKAGSKVGTSSLRRRYQLEAIRPDLEFVPLRGNVDTRLSKLKLGDYDAIILAAAGLNRLGLASEISDFLPSIPSVGQGAIAIETKSSATALIDLLKVFHCNQTARCVMAEREFLKVIQGGCELPIACHVSELNPAEYLIQGYLASADGLKVAQKEMNVNADLLVESCQSLAEQLLG